MKVYYNEKDLVEVTDMYYSIIISSLKNNNIEVIKLVDFSFKSLKNIKHDDFILATAVYDFAVLYLRGFRNIIFWFQGIVPEEDYLRLGKWYRKFLFEKMEKLALSKAKYQLFVTKQMQFHYMSKYKIDFSKKNIFIMPCFNAILNEKVFDIPEKYQKTIFCYSGGIQSYQCFDKIVSIYSKIENSIPDVFFKVLTFDINEAKNIIAKYNIKNFSVMCVPSNKVEEELLSCKYGFLIREDIPVNNVSSPTKIGNYLGAGVIPIYSDSICDFAKLAEGFKYLICIKDLNDITPIYESMSCPINPDEIRNEYTQIFANYYNKILYIRNMSKFFAGLN